MKEGRVKISDGEMFYRQQGGGEPLILLHAMGLSSELYLPVMDALSEKFDVYAVDLIGHGDSDKPDVSFEIQDHARSIIEFMDALKIKKTGVIGSSIGAMISIEMSVSYPDRVSKQVLAACPMYTSRWKALEDLMWLATRYDGDGNPIPQTVDQMKFIYAHPTQEITDWTNRLKANAGKWVKKNQIAIALWDPADKLHRVACPTQVVFGTEDGLIANEKLLLEGIKGAQGVRLEDASHFPPKEKPEEFVAAVLKFL